jgi:hypothetical protein
MKDRLITIALSVIATLGVERLGILATAGAGEEKGAARELVVDRLVVRKELIVSDTEVPWERGFEQEQIPRGIYARAGGHPSSGLWVRGRLHKCEIDDPFDDRFHAINTDKSPFWAPGHISWSIHLGGAWRQLAILQGEGLERSEMPLGEWSGGNHPGRLRFQTFRPHHEEPLTDAIIGQGMMSLGGGGYGGGGLPYPAEVLQLWGGSLREAPVGAPSPPGVVSDDGSGKRLYALVAVAPQGKRSAPSKPVEARGLATLRWDSATGADAYIVLRDGKEATGLLRIEGSEKRWTDGGK